MFRCRDPQLRVREKFPYVFDLSSNICKCWCFNNSCRVCLWFDISTHAHSWRLCCFTILILYLQTVLIPSRVQESRTEELQNLWSLYTQQRLAGGGGLSSKAITLCQCRFDVGTTSETASKHQPSIGSMYVFAGYISIYSQNTVYPYFKSYYNNIFISNISTQQTRHVDPMLC